MTTGMGVPPASSDPTTQADWLELKALAAADGNSSFQDLVAEIRRDGSTDAVQESLDALVDARGETSERLADDVFAELEGRVRAAGDGYPFSVGSQAIQLDPDALDSGSTYVFLLLLSWFGVDAGRNARVRPERDFEDISKVAAESYFGFNPHDGSYLFAFPRRTKAKGFKAAVDELAQLLGEGGGAKPVGPAANQKDANLDLVVWHGFADKRPGQLIAFGQCAAGANWTSKLSELPDTRSWCQAWMLDPPSVPAVRMFFVPHRLTSNEWKTRATIGGVLFERCRIAYHAPELPGSTRNRGIRWSDAVLDSRVRT